MTDLMSRSSFLDNMGLMPYRHPIVSVGTSHPAESSSILIANYLILFLVGRPISVTKNDKPTMEEMEEVQARYIIELKR